MCINIILSILCLILFLFLHSLARNLRGDFALAHFELVVDNEDHLSGPICYTKVVA
jgi:hypothetical protein